MKYYNGFHGKVRYLGMVSGKEFEVAYNAISEEEGKLPIASTIIPCTSIAMTDDATPLFFAWIFYKEAERNKEVKVTL